MPTAKKKMLMAKAKKRMPTVKEKKKMPTVKKRMLMAKAKKRMPTVKKRMLMVKGMTKSKRSPKRRKSQNSMKLLVMNSSNMSLIMNQVSPINGGSVELVSKKMNNFWTMIVSAGEQSSRIHVNTETSS